MSSQTKTVEQLQQEHDYRVFDITKRFRHATAAETFADAAWNISDALYAIDLRGGIRLEDDDYCEMSDALSALRYRSSAWAKQCPTLEAGLAAVAKQIERWNMHEPRPKPTRGETYSIGMRARMLRNDAHNASMRQGIEDYERARKLEEERIVNLADWRSRRGDSE